MACGSKAAFSKGRSARKKDASGDHSPVSPTGIWANFLWIAKVGGGKKKEGPIGCDALGKSCVLKPQQA